MLKTKKASLNSNANILSKANSDIDMIKENINFENTDEKIIAKNTDEINTIESIVENTEQNISPQRQIISHNAIANQNIMHTIERQYPQITSPQMNSVYKINGVLPIEYQRISLEASIPSNAKSYIWYCNGQQYMQVDNDSSKSVRWQIRSGSHKFKVAAIFDDGSFLESDIISINVK